MSARDELEWTAAAFGRHDHIREFDRTRRCRILEVERVESLQAAQQVVRERIVDRVGDRKGESPSEQ